MDIANLDKIIDYLQDVVYYARETSQGLAIELRESLLEPIIEIRKVMSKQKRKTGRVYWEPNEIKQKVVELFENVTEKVKKYDSSLEKNSSFKEALMPIYRVIHGKDKTLKDQEILVSTRDGYILKEKHVNPNLKDGQIFHVSANESRSDGNTKNGTWWVKEGNDYRLYCALKHANGNNYTYENGTKSTGDIDKLLQLKYNRERSNKNVITRLENTEENKKNFVEIYAFPKELKPRKVFHVDNVNIEEETKRKTDSSEQGYFSCDTILRFMISMITLFKTTTLTQSDKIIPSYKYDVTTSVNILHDENQHIDSTEKQKSRQSISPYKSELSLSSSVDGNVKSSNEKKKRKRRRQVRKLDTSNIQMSNLSDVQRSSNSTLQNEYEKPVINTQQIKETPISQQVKESSQSKLNAEAPEFIPEQWQNISNQARIINCLPLYYNVGEYNQPMYINVQQYPVVNLNNMNRRLTILEREKQRNTQQSKLRF